MGCGRRGRIREKAPGAGVSECRTWRARTSRSAVDPGTRSQLGPDDHGEHTRDRVVPGRPHPAPGYALPRRSAPCGPSVTITDGIPSRSTGWVYQKSRPEHNDTFCSSVSSASTQCPPSQCAGVRSQPDTRQLLGRRRPCRLPRAASPMWWRRLAPRNNVGVRRLLRWYASTGSPGLRSQR